MFGSYFPNASLKGTENIDTNFTIPAEIEMLEESSDSLDYTSALEENSTQQNVGVWGNIQVLEKTKWQIPHESAPISRIYASSNGLKGK